MITLQERFKSKAQKNLQKRNPQVFFRIYFVAIIPAILPALQAITLMFAKMLQQLRRQPHGDRRSK